MALRRLVAGPLHVEAHFIGRALASPSRRFIAIGIDWLVLIVPTVAVALGAAVLSLRVSDPKGFDAIRHINRLRDAQPAVAHAEARALVPLLVRLEPQGLPPAVGAAVEAGDLDTAADLLRDENLVFALKLFEEVGDAKLPPKTIRVPVERIIPGPIRAIALLGVPALYFAAFSRSRRGSTVGKRMLGIRVVRLDGERLSWLEAIERFVGYVHIPATGFVSLLDLWRDPNRRLPHDRTVHTAVLREEVPKKAVVKLEATPPID